MILGKTIFVLDSQTAGWPTRIVIGGIPSLPGKTMKEKAEYFKNKLDFIRTALFWEPRRLKSGVGAVITTPVDDKADLGVLFMDAKYQVIPTCGSGSMGVITAAIDYGMVEAVEPITEVTLDTVSGLVTGRAEVEKGRVKSVSVRFPPFYFYKTVNADVPDVGSISVDIAPSPAGVTIALVNAKDLGVAVEKKNKDRLSQLAIAIRDAVDSKCKVEKPLLVRIYENLGGDEKHARNVTVLEPGDMGIDRSPCGTGTSGHLATLYSHGKIGVGEETIHESIIGTVFKGKIISTTKVNGFDAVVPEIAGSSYTMGMCTIVLDPNDPIKYGFSF